MTLSKIKKVRSLVLFAIAGIVVFGVGATATAEAGVSVSGVRHSATGNNTRIVIDLSGRGAYKIFRLSNPHRIAINITGARAASAVRARDVEDAIVKRIRINRLSWGTQVVLDLKARGTWRDFYLSPVDNMPNRIVLDVEADGVTSLARTPTPRSTQPKTQTKSTGRKIIVAIDAGHGGKDPGALGRNRTVEKKEALSIAKRLAREIDSYKGYKSVLVRDRDVFLEFRRRTQIAQEKNADIFVSIHLNSAPKRSARGSEVYFLSPRGAKQTANRVLRDKNKVARQMGIDGASNDIIHMLVDINQQAMLQRSELLAEEILGAMKQRGLPPTRSIKQKSFAVLKSIAMPSVMVETGFLTNTKDAAILKSDTGKDQIAKAIAKGVISFLKKYPPAADSNGRLVVHRVKKGETLWKLSRRYNTTVVSIQKSNRMGASKMIRVGQELVIPEGNETY